MDKKAVVELDSGEYFISAAMQDTSDYKIFYKGEELRDCVGIVRSKVIEDFIKEREKKK